MTDCGCEKARESMEEYLHGETDESTSGDVADHLACCDSCEQEWKIGYSLSVSVKRACCEEAPEELKASIVESIRAHGSTKLGAMASHGERSKFFPAIEARYGHPMEHWWDVLGQSGLTRYPDQMSLLQEQHGFSRSHANAAVMAYRGSHSSSRFSSPEDYFVSLEATHQQLARDIIHTVLDVDSTLTLVMAWNQPIVRSPADYVFGLSASRHHLSINPFSPQVLQDLASRLSGLDVLKHTVRIPLGWSIDTELLTEMVSLRLAEIA